MFALVQAFRSLPIVGRVSPLDVTRGTTSGWRIPILGGTPLISKSCHMWWSGYDDEVMRDLAILFIHLIATLGRALRPGGLRSVAVESLLVKHQLLMLNRSRERAPNLRPMDRVITGLCAGFMRPTRLIRSAIVLKPSTIMSFHRALVKRKYRLLFSPKRRGKPGPKGVLST